MAKKHKPKEMVAKLRQVDILTSQATPISSAGCQLISGLMCYGSEFVATAVRQCRQTQTNLWPLELSHCTSCRLFVQ